MEWRGVDSTRLTNLDHCTTFLSKFSKRTLSTANFLMAIVLRLYLSKVYSILLHHIYILHGWNNKVKHMIYVSQKIQQKESSRF